jgi:intracellular multiplication protein IcmC
MWNTIKNKSCKWWPRVALIVCYLLFLPGCAKLIDGSEQALVKMQTLYVAFADLVISVAYVSGVFFVVKGIFSFKQYGEQRTMMSSQTTVRVPLTYFTVGVLMLYLPKLISIMSNAAFAQPVINIIGFQGDVDNANNIKNAVYALVQIVGLISVVRSLFIASNPHPGGGQGGFGKAVVHFVAGLIALNITYVMKLLENYT